MNPWQIKRLFPGASQSTLNANSHDYGQNHPEDSRQTPALERNPGNAPLETRQVQEGGSGKIHVRIESVRVRLADPDGLCEKFVLDCCRYAGLIPDDTAEDITLETTQRKAAKGEEEHTLIEITRPALLAEIRKGD